MRDKPRYQLINYTITDKRDIKTNDIKSYKIVTIGNVRFVIISLLCQEFDSVYFYIYKRKEYPELGFLKDILYIVYSITLI